MPVGLGTGEKLIGIKPNLVSPVEASRGGTHPEVLPESLSIFRNMIFIRSLCWKASWGRPYTGGFIRCVVSEALSQKYQVPFLGYAKDKGVAVEVCSMTFKCVSEGTGS